MTIEELKQKHGELVSKEVLSNILSNYRMSNHAIDQLRNRSDMLVENERGIDWSTTKSIIKYAIDKNILAYYNTDGSVNVALDKFHYFVFAYNEDRCNWTMITYKEMSWYGIDIYQKRQMAIDGFDRKY